MIARDDVDIIHTCTPPHWHAHMAIAAAKAGKAIWGEKPMSRTIGEGMAMKKEIEKAGVAFRINTWFRFKSNFYGSGVTARQVKKVVATAKVPPSGLAGAGCDDLLFLLVSLGAHELEEWSSCGCGQ